LNYAKLVIVSLLGLALSACFFGGGEKKCKKPQEYQESRSATTIRVPDDLGRPADSVPMQIPEVPNEADERPADAPCLEEPPSYSG
jgi:uncharacterized lipoprotein